TNMESLKEFCYKVIFHEEPEGILPNIDTTKNDICMIYKGVINPNIKEVVIILNCKHFYYKECIREKCLQCQEITNGVENIPVDHQENNYSISSLLNLKHVIIFTSLTNYTEPTIFTEPIKPLMLTESTVPIVNIKFIESTESNEPTNANQVVIRSWYEFANELDKQINQTLKDQKNSKHGSSKKAAISEVYDKLLSYFADMTRFTLRKRVEKANK
ncbi:498_t:CDS:2, partial [Racocetra persica]